MASKKFDTKNVADLFISDAQPEADITAEEGKEIFNNMQAMKAAARPKKKEAKSRHLQLLLKPSTYEKLKAAAEADEAAQGSVNRYINDLLEKTLK